MSLSLALSSVHYTPVKMSGWTVMVHQDYFRPTHRLLASQTLTILQAQLGQCKQVLPAHSHTTLTKVKIWVEFHQNPRCKGNSGVYRFGSGEALLAHHLPAYKANAVEICGAKTFFDSTYTMPAHVLHELTHVYHTIALNKAQQRLIQQAYQQTLHSKRYRKVKVHSAAPRRAYALLNAREYFAEASESFFGRNNEYPFRRAQLRVYDPLGYKLVKQIWKVTQPPPPYQLTYGYSSYKWKQPRSFLGGR